jgi:hypothetical protein
MMKYLIYSTLAEATERCDTAHQTGQAAGLFTAGTTAYAIPIHNPFVGQWAVPVIDRYESLFSQEELAQAVELGSDWFQTGRIAGNFIHQQPISGFAADPTVTRQAVCNIPVVLDEREKTFQLTVVVRHFRNGVHIWEELPDRKVVLTAANDDGEFDTFYGYIAAGANMLELIGLNIAFRDSEAGGRRFD